VTVDNSDHVSPSTPGAFQAAPGLNNVSLSWTASTDDRGVIASYKVSRGATVVYNGTALSFNDTGLATGTAYSYSVVAIDPAGNNSIAATTSATTLSPKKGDVNNDNLINILDISYVISQWRTTDPVADVNKDGTVSIIDISIILSNWGL